MTVREAFEKAGHPVPEGAVVQFNEGNWLWRYILHGNGFTESAELQRVGRVEHD